MKLKERMDKPKQEASDDSGEEFFRLPRAETLAEEVREENARRIGDLVTNPSRRINNRFTLQITDNGMRGADIREGDYVVVETQVGYPEGCILAVQLGNRQLVRRYRRLNGLIQLMGDPSGKQAIVVENHTPDFRILGQVLQVIREVK